ncbi:hypothetical protein [Acinetobacter soli]|uniref:hypothetical protein n=1 Tax=Acinetobacter soli TaxID=487316 RepID=UPI001F3D7A86|nr:hypothetical protein [Acinetobacter soli]MCE6007591.1 hypothetical protein [Acinetobacter soli]
MKISLEIDIPEYSWVDAPTLYKTPIGDFGDIQEVKEIGRLIEYIQNLGDRHEIIDMDYRVREALCRSWIRERLRFINTEQTIYYFATNLSHFLDGFNKYSGLDFDAYEYKYEVLSNGKKIQFKTFSMMFDTEEEALRHIAKIYTSKKDFKFERV